MVVDNYIKKVLIFYVPVTGDNPRFSVSNPEPEVKMGKNPPWNS